LVRRAPEGDRRQDLTDDELLRIEEETRRITVLARGGLPFEQAGFCHDSNLSAATWIFPPQPKTVCRNLKFFTATLNFPPQLKVFCRNLKISTATWNRSPQLEIFHRNFIFSAATSNRPPQLGLFCRNQESFTAT
jgi:hypothetical protein